MYSKKLLVNKGKSKFNLAIILLTFVDIFVWASTQAAAPFIGIFLSYVFGSNSLEYIGIGTGIYFIVRSIAQLPIGAITDKIKKDHDEIIFLTIGSFFLAIPYLSYPFIRTPDEYYLLMAMGGLGASMNLNTWRKLFARNLERNHEGFSYGVYETVMSIAMAVFGFLGGYFSNFSIDTFKLIIFITGVFIFIGSALTLLLMKINRKG